MEIALKGNVMFMYGNVQYKGEKCEGFILGKHTTTKKVKRIKDNIIR